MKLAFELLISLVVVVCLRLACGLAGIPTKPVSLLLSLLSAASIFWAYRNIRQARNDLELAKGEVELAEAELKRAQEGLELAEAEMEAELEAEMDQDQSVDAG